jgi:hypothetical protein
MRNILFIAALLIHTSIGLADDTPVRALMTIHGRNVVSSEIDRPLPSVPFSEEVKRVMSQLHDGDEVLIEGHIHQETISIDDSSRVHSYLIIEKIHKVTLAELGDIRFNVPDPSLSFETKPFSPVAIPVTAEVASAMTMTTGMLLMENLSGSSSTDPEGRRQIRQSVMLSAGLMATVIFIYEQLKGSSKP